MRNKMRRLCAITLCISLVLGLAACGKSGGTEEDNNVGSVSGAFGDAINEIRQDDELGDHIGAAPEKLGGINFTILDSSTVKANINSPEILALATDMSEVQIKLFPDEEAREHFEGAFAFKMKFHEQDSGVITCNVYPQTCRVEQENGSNVIYDEDIPDTDGAPVVGATIIEDTMITFFVNYSGLSDIVKDNPYYSVNVDYEEYSRGRIDGVSEHVKVVPDLSQTTLSDDVDISFFDDVYPDYFVIESDYDDYISYDDYDWFRAANPARSFAIELLWGAKNNKEISKKSVMVGSIDEFGTANYYIAQVYNSHEDMIADYMQDDCVNLSLEFDTDDEDDSIITDKLLIRRYLPQDQEDEYGYETYLVDDHAIYWKYVPKFKEHYATFRDDNIKRVWFDKGGFMFGGEVVLEAEIAELLNSGNIDKDIKYHYHWVDVAGIYTNWTGESTVHLRGNYHESNAGDTMSVGNNEKILKEKQRIRKQLDDIAQAEKGAILNADRDIDPQAQCYIYDADSADLMLTKLDMDMLTSGGMYEIDCGDITLRITAETEDDPKCVIGRYNGDSFEEIGAAQSYRDLNSGTLNCIHLNVYLGDIYDVTWPQLAGSSFSFYEAPGTSGGKSARKLINNAISIERYDL